MCCVPGGVHPVVDLLLHVLPLQRIPAAQERHPALVDLVSTFQSPRTWSS